MKKIALLYLSLLIINCSGTMPSVGEEVSAEVNEKAQEVAKTEEVAVETFTIQEPESPPIPVSVFEPYMIKRGDFLTKIAL